MDLLLWLLAVVLFIAGVWQLFIRNFLFGIILIILAFLVGPGGISLFG